MSEQPDRNVRHSADSASGKDRRPDKARNRLGKHQRGVVEIIDDLLARKVWSPDRSQTHTFLEAIILQLWGKALAGDRRATAVLMRYRRRNPEPRLPQVTVIGGLPYFKAEREDDD